MPIKQHINSTVIILAHKRNAIIISYLLYKFSHIIYVVLMPNQTQDKLCASMSAHVPSASQVKRMTQYLHTLSRVRSQDDMHYNIITRPLRLGWNLKATAKYIIFRLSTVFVLIERKHYNLKLCVVTRSIRIHYEKSQNANFLVLI